jgi:hypothetical protein
LRSLLYVRILSIIDYGLKKVQNMCNEEFYIGTKHDKKFNVLSKTHKKSLVSQLTSGKRSSDYIFQLSKFSQTTL